jgi:hypothetical protein
MARLTKYGLDPGPKRDMSGPVIESVMPTVGEVMVNPNAMPQRRIAPPIQQMNPDIIRTSVNYRPSPEAQLGPSRVSRPGRVMRPRAMVRGVKR